MSERLMLWRRLDAPGHDACRLQPIPGGWRLSGAAVFHCADGPAALQYVVECDAAWASLCGSVRGFLGEREIDLSITRSDGAWSVNGRAAPGLDHLLDLDLGFTPATNLLPIRRVPLAEGQAGDLPAAWLDVDAGTLSELPQRYERRGPETFWYESPSAGYEALLEVEPSGFVRRYPGLWEAERP